MREGWELKTLSDFSDVRDGTHDSPKYQDEGYALITSKNLKNGKLVYDKIKYISEEDYISINKRSKVDIGDILFAMIGTIGNPIVIEDEPDFAIKNVALFKVYDTQESKFLKYYLDSPYVIKKMQKDAKGTTQKFVGLGYLRKFPIPIPPLSEQKQIVDILDKAFKKIELAKANIEQNLQNAKELFESKLNEIFSQRGEGWVEKRLGDVCRTGSGGTPLKSKKDYYNNGTIPWICSGEVKQGNIYKSANFITEEGLNNSSAKLFPINSVLIAMYGATAGEVGILRFKSSTNQAICAILPCDELLPEFIYYSFLFRKNELISKATGNAQPNISQIKIKNTMIPVIEKERQVEIIKQLNDLQDNIKLLNSNYQQKLNNLEELKKSILQKAFKGELSYEEVL